MHPGCDSHNWLIASHMVWFILSLIVAQAAAASMLSASVSGAPATQLMQVQVVQGKEAMIQTLYKKLMQLKREHIEIQALENETIRLSAQKNGAEKLHNLDLDQLAAAKTNLQCAENRTTILELTIFDQHRYGVACHTIEERQRKRLAELQQRRNSVRDLDLEAEKDSVADLQDQHEIVYEIQGLKTRRFNGKANTATIQAQVLLTHEKFEALEQTGAKSLHDLRTALGEANLQAAAAETQLMDAELKRKRTEMEAAIEIKNVEQLQGQVATGALEQLKANNSQLKADLEVAHTALQESQAEMAKKEAQARIAKVEVAHLTKIAEASALRAQQIARESLAQVAIDKEGAERLQQKAEQASLDSEASSMKDCKELWWEKNSNVEDELQKCDLVKSDILNLNVQVTTLKETILSQKASS